MSLEHLLAKLPHLTDEEIQCLIKDAQHRARTSHEQTYQEQQLILIVNGLEELAKRKGVRMNG